MKMLQLLPKILEDAQYTWQHTIPADLKYDTIFDNYSCANHDSAGGQIITGDNLSVAKTLFAAIYAGVMNPIKLIYMDPPFFTKTAYLNTIKFSFEDGEDVNVPLEAFSDNWKNGDEEDSESDNEEDEFARYLTMIAARVIAAREMLGEDGSLWIHLDHHAAHYVKVICDEIFGGPEHMLNEVIWHYKSGGSTKKRFSRKHDTLLFYAKNPQEHSFSMLKEKSYNRGKKPYRFKGVKEYRDENGWYTLVNMRDVWQIDMVGRTSRERTGYATQKPEALIERLVTSCTQPGDYCMDLFAGSGTLAAVAEKNSRKWISIDISSLSALHAERRMVNLGSCFDILSDRPEDSNVIDFGLKVSFEDTADEGKKHAVVKIISYSFKDREGESILKIDEKYKKAITDISSIDIAQLVGSIAIDTDYNEYFNANAVSYNEETIEMLIKAEDAEKIRKTPRLMAVRIVDVFGNSFMRRLTAEDF